MEPRNIAEWITTIGPGKSGLLTEDLFGHAVSPGDTPGDAFLHVLDNEYVDDNYFRPSNPSFKQDVLDYTGIDLTKRGGIDLLVSVIMNSNQSIELKSELVSKIKRGVDAGKWQVTLKNGETIDADYLSRGTTASGRPFLYVAMDPGMVLVSKAAITKKKIRGHMDSRIWKATKDGGVRRYRTVLTVLIPNIANVRRLA